MTTSFWQVAAVGLALAFSSLSMAQEAVEEGDGFQDIEKIAVTGSRIKRIGIDGPAPVIVIDQVELAERGYTTVFDALADLAVNNGFKFEGPESTNGFTPDVQTINLRGFGVGTTLTLINGRRLANYPAAYQSDTTVFSFSSIPVAAVERIEILTTGASAIYGSDAVAGVVNIILRQDINGTTLDALWGTPTETHGTQGDLRLQMLNGKTFDRGSYTLTAEYVNREPLLGRDYDQYDNQQDDYPYATDANPGVYDRTLLTIDNWIAFGGKPGSRYRDPAVSLDTTGDQACALSGGDLIYAYRPDRGYFCADPTAGSAASNFQNQKESFSAYFNGQLDIGDQGTELFTDLLFYHAKSRSYANSLLVFTHIYDLTTEVELPDYGPGVYDYDWLSIQRGFTGPELGQDLDTRYKEKAWTAVIGARGTWGETQDWEVSANYSQYTFDSQMPALTWQGVIDNMLGYYLGAGPNGDLWSGGTLPFEDLGYPLGNPDYLYGPSNAALQGSIGTSTYENQTSDLFVQFAMTGDLRELNAGAVSYALVLEYEDETLEFTPDALLQQAPPSADAYGNPVPGLQGSGWYNLTGYSGAGDRQRWSIGGELSIPVLANLTVNLAGRYDHYDSTSSSIGGDFTPSASIEYRPVSALLLRAGYTSSFVAPDLVQVFVETGFYTQAFDYVSCQQIYEFQFGTTDGFDTNDCDPTNIFAQRVTTETFYDQPLGAETGDSFWVGFAWDIRDDLTLTLDYTNMELDHRVNTQNVQGLLNDDYDCYIGEEPADTPCDQVNEQIQRLYDPTLGVGFIENFYITSINQYKEKGEFIDIAVNYSLSTDIGLFNFEGTYNNVLSHSLQLTANSEVYDIKSDPLVGGWDYRSSFVGSVTWSYEGWSSTVTGIFRGETTVYNCTEATAGCVSVVTGEDYLETENWWVSSYLTFNWTASYSWADQWLVRARLVNVFDQAPPKDDTMQFFNNPWYNIYSYPGAGIGRYAAVELQYTF